jgi:Zn-dependent protease with chaperone function
VYIALLTLIPLFLIWDTQSPVAFAWLHMPPHLGVPIFFCGYSLVVLTERIWGRRLAIGSIRGDPGKALDRFQLGMMIARFCIPVWFAVGVYLLRWDNALLEPISHWTVTTPGILLGVAPALLTWMGLWWAQFPVDRAVREHNALWQLEADLPIFTPVNFRKYFMQKLRVQLLFVLVPWVVIQVLHDVAFAGMLTLARGTSGRHGFTEAWVRDWGDSGLSLLCLLIVVLISPELLRHVLHTERLPDMPLRKSLTEICKQSGIGCRDILLWRTHRNLGNAAVMGIVPRIRYVMLSDLLLESMTDEQIQAVFAHELGHVKHRHLVWFVAFLVAFSSAVLAMLGLIETSLHLTENQKHIYELASALLCCLAVWLSYGFLSRWFERQADVYAARTLQAVSLPSDPARDSGASIFASALQRVALVNNIPVNARNWTHGSIAARVRYIRKFASDPQVAERFDRTGRRVLWMLSLLIVLCTIIAMYIAFRG